jgi:ribosomal protein S20
MRRERIGRIGLASLLALGSLAGVAGVAGAQSTDTDTPSGSTSDRPRHRGPGLEAAAKALNLSEDELRAKLEDGTTTIAAVAAAQGVDVQTVIDAMVAAATADIDQKVADGDITEAKATEIKANLTEHITKRVNEGRPAGGPGGPGGPGGRGHKRPSLEAAAKALNLSEDELKTKLKDGDQTIAEVAKAQDVDVQTVIDAMVADATTHIDQAVTDGKIDEAKATEIKSNLKDRITKLVNEGPPARGEGGPDGGPPPAGNGDEEAPPS